MYALISVADKAGSRELAQDLIDLGYQIISTGGTASHLREAGLEVLEVSQLTGFPELLGGRVKTLHPKIFAGLLARKDDSSDQAQLAAQGIKSIDLVIVNLYPFAQAVKSGLEDNQVIEEIDIGGHSLLRAAAKNHERVWVVSDPADYQELPNWLKAPPAEQAKQRRELATRAFRLAALYDGQIGDWLAGDSRREFVVGGIAGRSLRYGENPHQAAVFYRDPQPPGQANLAEARQLQGKELSYNNLLDASAALELVREFADESAAFCCVLKHNNPCGAALAPELGLAFERAWAGDPLAAYGGVIGANREIDLETARILAPYFVELIIAPGFSPEALEALRAKKNLRLLVYQNPLQSPEKIWQTRWVSGGWLRQEADAPGLDPSSWETASQRQASPDEMRDAQFLWKIVKRVRSNAIVVGADQTLLGCGAGQMSRVDSVKIALEKVSQKESAPKGSLVLASDAFFPFRDGVDLAARAGVKTIVQPGGSIRDDEVRAACDEQGLAQILTHRRHFSH